MYQMVHIIAYFIKLLGAACLSFAHSILLCQLLTAMEHDEQCLNEGMG